MTTWFIQFKKYGTAGANFLKPLFIEVHSNQEKLSQYKRYFLTHLVYTEQTIVSKLYAMLSLA